MGTVALKLAVAEFATTGIDPDAARIVAARIALLDEDGAETARWDWGSDRADAVVGEVAQTLRTLAALGLPLAMRDAAFGLTILDRECRRRGIPAPDPDAPVLDPVLLDRVLDGSADDATFAEVAGRYDVAVESLAAGRLVRAVLERAALERAESPEPPARLLELEREAAGAPWPIVPLEDFRIIQDTQPIPTPAPRPSAGPPMLESVGTLTSAIEIPVVVEPAPAEPAPTEPEPGKSRRIHVAAGIVTDSAGRAVVVRKRGTTGFMQPGGKIERGESAIATLIRELAEEIGLIVDIDRTEFLGSFEAPALNEPGETVRAEVFAIETDAELSPGGEIEELHWLESPTDVRSVELAPLTLEVLLPLWAARRPALF